jgi:hypothetical protein
MANELLGVKTRSTKWVLEHLSRKDLKALREHIRQINLIAKNSGMWDFQRTGFFKQTYKMEDTLIEAIDDNVYEKKLEKMLGHKL